MSMQVQVLVRYSSQAYNCRSGKVSASSTSSALYAAERLAEKLYGEAVESVESAGAGPNYSEWFCITLKEEAVKA